MGVTEEFQEVNPITISSPIIIRQHNDNKEEDKYKRHSYPQSEDTRSEAGSISSNISCFELPEGSPAFESIMRELSDQLESTPSAENSPNLVRKTDDGKIRYWCDVEHISSSGSTISFSEDTKPCSNSDSELSINSPDINRIRTNSTGSPANLSSKPPRPKLLQRSKSANPFAKKSILRKGTLNRFPLRKSATPSPTTSPLLPRSKSTQVVAKSTTSPSNQKTHQFKYVFQTVNITVSHEDLVMEKQAAERNRLATSMFDDVHPCNPDLTLY